MRLTCRALVVVGTALGMAAVSAGVAAADGGAPYDYEVGPGVDCLQHSGGQFAVEPLPPRFVVVSQGYIGVTTDPRTCLTP